MGLEGYYIDHIQAFTKISAPLTDLLKKGKAEHIQWSEAQERVYSLLKEYIVISTAQTDLGLISRTFSLKMNKLPAFSEINQGWRYLNIVFIRSDELNFNFTLYSKPSI